MYNFKRIYYKLCPSQIDYEILNAHLRKLPNTIKVSWFRDGKYIIGKIHAEGKEYITQAISAKEFVEMVNDVLLSIYNIPVEFVDIAAKYKKFVPPQEDFEKLNNINVSGSNLQFIEQKVYA